jgi:hypothetical protein
MIAKATVRPSPGPPDEASPGIELVDGVVIAGVSTGAGTVVVGVVVGVGVVITVVGVFGAVTGGVAITAVTVVVDVFGAVTDGVVGVVGATTAVTVIVDVFGAFTGGVVGATTAVVWAIAELDSKTDKQTMRAVPDTGNLSILGSPFSLIPG